MPAIPTATAMTAAYTVLVTNSKLESVGSQHFRVHRHLVAAAQLEDVVEHDVVRGDLRDFAIPEHPRRSLGQDRQPVKRALRAQFLGHPDAGVDHQHDAEQRVLERPDNQHHHEQRAKYRVEPGQHVGAEDLSRRAAGRARQRVHLPGPHPLAHLRLAEPGQHSGHGGVTRR